MSIYLELTREFNSGGFRAIICSGQAVVLHKLAVMSKDGDWIVKESQESFEHILRVLNHRAAKYRFGAPFDIRWQRWGWSSHFEFVYNSMRIRTDFFSRPPRIAPDVLLTLWDEQKTKEVPFVDAKVLADLKKTNREKDYPVIGELARLMSDPRDQFMYSRSARDLIGLAERYPQLLRELESYRAILSHVSSGLDALQTALDEERRTLIRENENRLLTYTKVAQEWQKKWHEVEIKVRGLPLIEAHDIIVSEALNVLPFNPDSHE